MATLDQKFEAFRAKYDLTEEATTEMLAIFNETFIELAHKLLSNTEIAAPMAAAARPKTTVTRKNPSVSSGVKKFATKIAAEYAAERGFTLDDFDKEKITKKDIDELAKNGNTNTNSNSNISGSTSASTVIPEEPEKTIPKLMTDMCQEIKNTKKKSVQKCHGVNRDGSPCDKTGDQKPDNCSNYYCFRHALDWKKYEVSSDSELEEEEMIFKDLAIATED